VKAVASTVDLNAIIKEKDLEIERLRKLILATPNEKATITANTGFCVSKDKSDELNITIPDLNKQYSSSILDVITPTITEEPVISLDNSNEKLFNKPENNDESFSSIPPPPPLSSESDVVIKAPCCQDQKNQVCLMDIKNECE
jgi:hypothetical protein